MEVEQAEVKHRDKVQSLCLVITTKNTIYLFTTDRTGWEKGFQYHIITRYETDSFVVMSKNNFVRNGVAEPIAAINHQNGKDVWIFVRQYNSRNL